MTDPRQQFREALKNRGITPPDDLIANGKIHRCNVEGRSGKNDGSYLLHLDGIAAGGFENWQDGKGWENWRSDPERTLTESEKKAHEEAVNEARKARDAENARRRLEAQERAQRIWNEAQPCTDHEYLTRKGIAANGTRTHEGCLIIPLRDENHVLHSLQFIEGGGSKRFLSGGRVQSCYFSMGTPNGVLCIAEGFATGASILNATGHAVAVAFNASNLKAVAEALRAKHPNLTLVICADDDYRTESNPGLSKARDAAKAVGGRLAVPEFGPERSEGATDFNDLYLTSGGPEAVARCINKALNSDQPKTDAAKVSKVDEIRQDNNGPKYHKFGEGKFQIDASGITFVGTDGKGDDTEQIWVCSPLSIVAMTRDEKSGRWGRLLEWRDPDRSFHQWAMPLELLQGDGAEVRRVLAENGLEIAPGRKARDLLSTYLQVWPVQSRARCVERLGWHGNVYVTATGTIGQSEERVVFQNNHALQQAFSTSGTLDDWQRSVAALAVGNSRLLFAISTALAGPLIELALVDSGGFHLRGGSSKGKSTAVEVAASVWGHPKTYTRKWRATVNGLEGLAYLHNDGLLILDEIGQADPREVGEAAYLLANGQGKARATRAGFARPSLHWRLFFLSAGEDPLSVVMAKAGMSSNVGQEIRLADIEADAGAGMGVFEILHHLADPEELARAFTRAATENHGAIGEQWLRYLIENRTNLIEGLPRQLKTFTDALVPPGSEGQVIRVARRFAAVAVAGELATEHGLTGWKTNEAWHAVQKCFSTWLESFGGTANREERKILAQVKKFFEQHGASRFEKLGGEADQRVINRAGYYRCTDHMTKAREYLVFTEVFKNEICNGLDTATAIKALVEVGWLVKGKDGRPTQKTSFNGAPLPRCYVFNERMWEAEE